MSLDLNLPAPLAADVLAPAPPAALSTPPNPVGLLKALRRRWRWAVGTGLTLATAAAITTYSVMPPGKHTARTQVRVPPEYPFLFKVSVPVPGLQDHQKNQVAMARSRLVLNTALKDPRAADLAILRDKAEPVAWLEREVTADFNVAPEILRMTISGDKPNDLVALINCIRDAYKQEILDRVRLDLTERLRLLGEWREKYNGQLEARRKERRDLEKLAGGRDSNARTFLVAFTQQQLNANQGELLKRQSELRRARADLEAMVAAEKNLDAAAVPEAVVEEQLNREPAVVAASAKLQHLQYLHEQQTNVLKDKENHPIARDMRRQIAEAEKALNELRARLRDGALETIRQRNRFDAGSKATTLRNHIAMLVEDEKMLRAEIENTRKELNEKSENDIRAEVVREKVSPLEAVLKRIEDEEQQLKLELEAPPRYSVLEEGLAVRPPEGIRVLLAVGGVSLGTFVAVLLGFALVEFRARRVGEPDEVVFGLGLPLVAAIPDSAAGRSPGLPGEGDQPLLNEAVDTFRTMLLKAGEAERLRVVLITSAEAGEGKTSLSTHLAASLAQVGHATLLIDGDLRNPLAHRVFDLDRGPGLCDLLREQATLDEVIRPTAVGRLWMITAGYWDGTATRALAQVRSSGLIDELRRRFDFIIIDSSPVLPIVDPLLLGQVADGAILSVLSDVSRMPNVYAAYQRLTAGGVRVLGAVMNGVRSRQYGAYYPYRDREPEPAVAGAEE